MKTRENGVHSFEVAPDNTNPQINVNEIAARITSHRDVEPAQNLLESVGLLAKVTFVDEAINNPNSAYPLSDEFNHYVPLTPVASELLEGVVPDYLGVLERYGSMDSDTRIATVKSFISNPKTDKTRGFKIDPKVLEFGKKIIDTASDLSFPIAINEKAAFDDLNKIQESLSRLQKVANDGDDYETFKAVHDYIVFAKNNRFYDLVGLELICITNILHLTKKDRPPEKTDVLAGIPLDSYANEMESTAVDTVRMTYSENIFNPLSVEEIKSAFPNANQVFEYAEMYDEILTIKHSMGLSPDFLSKPKELSSEFEQEALDSAEELGRVIMADLEQGEPESLVRRLDLDFLRGFGYWALAEYGNPNNRVKMAAKVNKRIAPEYFKQKAEIERQAKRSQLVEEIKKIETKAYKSNGKLIRCLENGTERRRELKGLFNKYLRIDSESAREIAGQSLIIAEKVINIDKNGDQKIDSKSYKKLFADADILRNLTAKVAGLSIDGKQTKVSSVISALDALAELRKKQDEVNNLSIDEVDERVGILAEIMSLGDLQKAQEWLAERQEQKSLVIV